MYLRQVPMFSGCSEEQLDRVAELGESVAASAGHEIVREGESGDTFYVIASGKARVSRHGSDVAMLGAGGYFGELALFDDAPRNATVTADSDVSMITLSRANLALALNEMPAIRDVLLQAMARRIHELDARP
jgi:CRP-like cAMP-binding protein